MVVHLLSIHCNVIVESLTEENAPSAIQNRKGNPFLFISIHSIPFHYCHETVIYPRNVIPSRQKHE